MFQYVPLFNSSIIHTFEFKLFEGTNIIEIHFSYLGTSNKMHTIGIENQSGTYLRNNKITTIGTMGVNYYYGSGLNVFPSVVTFIPPTITTATIQQSTTAIQTMP